MALPGFFQPAVKSAYKEECQESDLIRHELVYHVNSVKDIQMVKDILKIWPDSTVYPWIDWHRKHRSMKVQGKDIFLYTTEIADGESTVRLPVHGAAPTEDWLGEGGPYNVSYFVLKHCQQLLFIERSQLATFYRENCPHRSAAQYVHLPLGTPEQRPPHFRRVQ